MTVRWPNPNIILIGLDKFHKTTVRHGIYMYTDESGIVFTGRLSSIIKWTSTIKWRGKITTWNHQR